MNAQSNTPKDNGAEPAASTRLDDELPCADNLARLSHKLRSSLNTIGDVTKQLELRYDDDHTTGEVRQSLRAPNDSSDTKRETAQPDLSHRTVATTVNPHCDVLHIEDDSSNFASVKLLLGSKRKLKVLRAVDGEEGIALAQTYAPGLILLDLDLPDIHGSEVIERLQEEPATAGIPIVVISGDTTPSQIERLLILGARNYLTKPLNPQVLLAVVDGILEEITRRPVNRRTVKHVIPFGAAQDKPRQPRKPAPYLPHAKTRNLPRDPSTGAAFE